MSSEPTSNSGITPESQPSHLETEVHLPEMIRLMDLIPTVTVEDVRRFIPAGDVVTTDYNLVGVEDWDELRDRVGTLIGFRRRFPEGSITNFDHHSRRTEFYRQVSSIHCALAYVREHGPVTDPIVIHHTDCDSVLSSLVLSGALPPDDRFGRAVLAADHTGEANDIADLLQAIQDRRDPQYSYEQLGRLIDGHPLDGAASRALDQRRTSREDLKRVPFQQFGETGVYYAQLTGRVDGEFAPALLPAAMVIVLASPMPDGSGKWEIKVRAGNQFPPGWSLQELKLDSFGGRWNAGSSKRHGGSALGPEAYAQHVAERLTERGQQR